jgi:anti-sigma factor RsiW
MNCERVRSQLADYSAGFAQGAERLRMAEHLSACAACRERLDEFRALDSLFAEDRVVADEQLVRGVMVEVAALGKPQRPVWLVTLEQLGPLVHAGALLPLLAMVVLGVVQWSASSEAAVFLPLTPHASPIAMGLGIVLCGLAATAMAWFTWRAAEAVA